MLVFIILWWTLYAGFDGTLGVTLMIADFLIAWYLDGCWLPNCMVLCKLLKACFYDTLMNVECLFLWYFNDDLHGFLLNVECLFAWYFNECWFLHCTVPWYMLVTEFSRVSKYDVDIFGAFLADKLMKQWVALELLLN